MKIKRKIFSRTIIGLVVLLALVLTVIAGTDDHTTTLSIGNSAPYIKNVYNVPNVDLSAGTFVNVYVAYNVTDNNGFADINTSEAKVYLNKTGETTRSNATGTCSNTNDGINTVTFNCTIPMYFYDSAGLWTINATIIDNQGSSAYNISFNVTVNTLDDILFNDTAISCGTNLLSPSIDNACDDLLITNRGNQDYTSMNETGYHLDDDTTGTYIIDASEFSVNTTDSVNGTYLVNATETIIPDSTLSRGQASNLTWYMYADIPSSRPADSYTSTQNWIIEAIV